ncbi:8511_t:CDS:2 [Gigaspora rosea]|nr:8511_t:CDS:2 [Gigaspora rosea]
MPDFKIKIKLLENKDLLMIITNAIYAIFIWTIKMEKIRLHYFWWYNEESKLGLFQKKQEENLPYLLPPVFKTKIDDLEICNFNELMEEMVKDYIDSRFKLGLYGISLMQYLLKNQNSEYIEMLLENIIKFTIQNSNRNYISNLPLMNLVTDNFKPLCQYPEIINLFLSRIAFFVPDDVLSEIVNKNSKSSHLQKFGTYPDPTVKLVFPLMGLTNYYNLFSDFSDSGKKRNILDKIAIQVLVFTSKLGLLSDNSFAYSPETDLYKFGLFVMIFALLCCLMEFRYYVNLLYLPWLDYIKTKNIENKPTIVLVGIRRGIQYFLVEMLATLSAVYSASLTVHFYEAHLDELRKIVKQIKNDDWPGTYKPYISDILLKAIHMSNENSNEDKDNK